MERADVDFPIADQFPIFPPYCFNQTRSMVFIMENNSFFPGSPCIDACFFFRTFIFYYFFFPLKLHVIDRTAAYTCGTRTLQQLSPLVSIYLEKNSFIIPLPSHPSQICGFSFCFSLFFPHTVGTKFQAVLLTRSSDSKREKRIPHCIPLR